MKIEINPPYLILLGDVKNSDYVKTGLGIVQWSRELVAGQLRFNDCLIDMGVPDMSISEALEHGVKSLIVGVNPVGGQLPESWWSVIEEAARSGLDIVSGLHEKLNNHKGVVSAAQKSGAKLIDVRSPPVNLPVGTHIKRQGKRLLTVATDCASGKKYTALAMTKYLNQAKVDATFRATGQTGIMIAGEGIPIDSVIADFISGASELVSPNNNEHHWDVIEGQGSLFHPGYSGVSLGLLHGSQPDAIIICHDALRTVSFEGHSLPSIQECIDIHLTMGRINNPKIVCVGVCVNTSQLSKDQRDDYLLNLENITGLPCVDPLIDGCEKIVKYLNGACK